MKLSEAIRLGSMSLKPLKYYMVDNPENPTKACALGAAQFASGSKGFLEVARKFPILEMAVGELDGSNITTTLTGRIAWLNDQMGWSREAIADWVEQLENNLEKKNAAEQSQGTAQVYEAEVR